MSNLIKKTFLVSMVALTALWGVMGAVNVASANIATAGDLIRSASSPAVYYLDASNVKHPFHHEREYYTWYPDFSLVKIVPTDEMVSYTLGSTIVVRPGTRLAQYVEVLGDGTWSVSNTPAVYAVGLNGTLNHIDSAATAVAKYGSNWESMIVPLPNYLAANYANGSALTSSSNYPTGTLVKTAGSSQVYYINGSTKQPVTDAGFTANRFDLDYVVTASSLSGYTDGTSITALDTTIANPVAGSSIVAGGTGLTAALASTTPGAQVAPLSSTNVPLLRFNLTAGSDGAVTVTAVNVKRGGPGNTSDFTSLYLYDGATRLTNGKTLNSTTQIAQFTNLALTIAAGSTKTLTVSGDVSTGTAGTVHYFTVESGAITTTAAVSGSFPIASQTTTLGSVSAGTITVAKNGTLANPVIGQIQAAIAQFKLTAGSGEDVQIERLTFYQGGSINNTYLTNLKLYQASTLLASTPSITTNGLMVFDLAATPYSIEKNTNKIFTVKADVSGSGRDGDTTKIYLENAADVYAIGKVYGYGAGVTYGDYDGGTTGTTQSANTDSTYLIAQGGQITVAMNGPVSGTLSKGTTEAVMMNFSITAGVNAEVRKLRVELHNDGGAGADLGATAATDASATNSCSSDYIYNVKIVDTNNGESTGAINCSSFTNIHDADGVYYDFTDYFSFSSGQTRNFAIKASLHNSLDADDYYVTLGSSSTNYAVASSNYTLNTADSVKNTDNNQWITDVVPTTVSTGNEMTIAGAGLYVSLSSNPSANTIVQGTNNVTLAKFAIKALDGSAITISGMTLTGYVSTSTTVDFTVAVSHYAGGNHIYVNNMLSNLKLYDEGADPTYTTNLNSTTEGLDSTTGAATFSNMNWTIPAGTTKTLVVKGDVSNTAYANGVSATKYVKVDFVTNSDITCTDSSGTSVTMLDGSGGPFDYADGNGVDTSATAGAITSAYYLAITNSGTLNVTAGGGVNGANVVAGLYNVPVLNLSFQAINESFNVNKFRIFTGVTPTSTYKRAVNSVTVTYVNQAGTTVSATQTMLDGAADFNITANPLYVAPGSDKTVNVFFNLAVISATSGAYTSDLVKAVFNKVNFEAKSAGSGSTNLTQISNMSSGNVSGNNMIVHGANLTITADSTTNVDLQPGPVELYRFQVAATQGGTDVILKKLSFKMSMTDSVKTASTLSLTNFQVFEGSSYADTSALEQSDTASNGYAVYNGYGATTSVATGIVGGGGKLSNAAGVVYQNVASQGAAGASATNTHDVIVVFNDDRLITAGTSKYYIIKANAGAVNTGATASNDSIGMYLYDGDSSQSASTTMYITAHCDTVGTSGKPSKYCLTNDASGTTDTTAWMIWSDKTGIAGSLTHTDISSGDGSSADWFNGYNVKTLSVQRTLN